VKVMCDPMFISYTTTLIERKSAAAKRKNEKEKEKKRKRKRLPGQRLLEAPSSRVLEIPTLEGFLQ
jgi:hypothetical protein